MINTISLNNNHVKFRCEIFNIIYNLFYNQIKKIKFHKKILF